MLHDLGDCCSRQVWQVFTQQRRVQQCLGQLLPFTPDGNALTIWQRVHLAFCSLQHENANCETEINDRLRLRNLHQVVSVSYCREVAVRSQPMTV